MIKRITFLLLCLLGITEMGIAQTNPPLNAIRDTTRSDYVWVAAHRGDWIYAPENSLESLRHDIYWGVNLMETDVRLTKDGKIIMMHDWTVDRTTNGHGAIADMTLAEIKKLRLKSNFGTKTNMQVPTLEEFIKAAGKKVFLYLDKAGQDLPGNPQGYMVKQLLKVLKDNNALEESVFVLDWPYQKAKEIFGDDLERVVYVPVIQDDIPNLKEYVNEYIYKLHPVAFQFRMASLDSDTYRLLPVVLKSGAKPFIAATWAEHTANHDDQTSLFKRPSAGWGWLIDKGFRIIETNYPLDVITYLKSENRH